MQIQYKILKDFDIKPKILIIYIDQTDIGDEFADIKNKIYSNSKILLELKEKNIQEQHTIILNFIYTLN